MRQSLIRIHFAIAVIALVSTCFGAPSQSPSPVFTVAQAKYNAPRLGSRPISVRGHLWLGKEGSMIHDDKYKAILTLHFSDAFWAKHSYPQIFPSGKTRKSDVVTITGQLGSKSGKLFLIADDIQFAEDPH